MSSTQRALILGQTLLLVASVLGVVLVSDAQQWRPIALLLLLLALAVLSESFRIVTKRFTISAAFLALVLAMVLAGPAPAALLGAISVAVSCIRRNTPWQTWLANISTYAFFPLVGGIAFRALGGPELLPDEPVYYLLAVYALFISANLVNFLLIAIYFKVFEGPGLRSSLRNVYLPVLPVEFATGLLTAGVALASRGNNLAAIALLAIVGFVFQYLLRTALSAIDRKEQLERRTHELAALQVGLLGTVLQTLSLRDKMTARHSAAVARYSREIARELGLSERDQDLVHTAGLLHDIGKFTFPDSILLANRRLSAADMEIVRRHPEQGAWLVGRIDGYGPVAESVLSHHERIDGTGYPYGLVGDQIPLAARIIAVADTYDVMTARDSYRTPVKSREAIDELRRVSGTQLDARIVATFIILLKARSLTFRHADDADFELELALDQRVRDYAEPRSAAR